MNNLQEHVDAKRIGDCVPVSLVVTYRHDLNNLLLELYDKINALAELHPYKQVGSPQSYSQYNEGFTAGIDYALQAFTDFGVILPKERALTALTSGESK